MDGVFDFDYGFGSFLREIRKEQKISMRELGEVVGVSEQAISQYERGLRPLRHSMAEKIAEALNTSVARVLSDYGWYDDDIPELFDGDVDAYEEAKRADAYENAKRAENKNAVSFFESHGYMISFYKEDCHEKVSVFLNDDTKTFMLTDFLNLYHDMSKQIENFIHYTIDRALSTHNDQS